MPSNRMSVEQALVQAKTLTKRGDIDHAMQLYRAVLDKFPSNRRAMEGIRSLRNTRRGLGEAPARSARHQEQVNHLIALYNQRQLQEAFQLGTALARQYPDMPLILNILGAINADSGRLEEAVASYTKALKLKPGYAEAHNNLGNALNALGRQDEAIASYSRALELKPGYAEAHNNLGNVLNDLGRHEGALASLTRAVELRPEFAVAHNSLGNAFVGLRQFAEAVASYSRAVELKPGYVEAHDNLGQVYNRMGRQNEAIASLTRALELRPDFAEAHVNLGIVLVALDRKDEAVTSFSKALELKPDYAKAIRNLALLHHFQPGDPLIGELTRQLASWPHEGPERCFVLEALGKAHDDTCLYDEAFSYYREANETTAGRLHFDPAAQRTWVEAVKEAFPEPLLCSNPPTRPVTPVFVVGMSRSGKTMVESLLTQHQEVTGLDESRELQQALDRVLEANEITDPFPACIGSLAPEQISEVGDQYLDALRRRPYAPGTRFFVNTLPGHYGNLGLIFRAFPSVRVIYCTRDPLDHCLFIYLRFYAGGNAYAYDLANLAAYFRNYQDMMEHWLRLYGEHVLIVDYETLVREPQETVRRLYAHCGLDLPPAELDTDFHTGQIGHARHYEAQLAPLREALGLEA